MGEAANPELAGQTGALEQRENGASLVVFGAVATWVRDEWVETEETTNAV